MFKRLLIVLLFASCTQQPIKKENIWQYEDISHIALEKYGQELLKANPVDAIDFCPNFSFIDKLDFYTRFLEAVSYRESGHDPEQEYKEKFNVKGDPCTNDCVISTGLMQMSEASCAGYGVKTTTEGLKNPTTNITCAVKVLNQWVPRDKHLATDKLGCGRYWSVCRPGESKTYIRNVMREWCNV
jgi:hypothetical protein